MLSRSRHEHTFSDDTIRQFLLGRLREKPRSAFERTLFLDSELGQRTRLMEICLADDFATGKLRASERAALLEVFPFSASRQRQIEVSTALRACFAQGSQEKALTFKHPSWKWAFASMILILLFATIWLATKEPQIARRLVPRRLLHSSGPAVPSPEVGHHAEHAKEPGAHRDELPPPPAHEAAVDSIVLDSTVTAENAPTVKLGALADKDVHFELMLDENSPATFKAELLTSGDEVVYGQEVTTLARENRIALDIQRERLLIADYKIRLTRMNDRKVTIYFLRVR